MRYQDADQNVQRSARLPGAGIRTGHAALAAALAVLLLPISGKAQVSPAPSALRSGAALGSSAQSPEEKLRLLEARFAALTVEYANRTGVLVETLDRLAESMARLGEQQDWNTEKTKLLADNKNLRDLAAAKDQRLSNAESLCRQAESTSQALRDEFAERGALLAVAERDRSAGEAERVALRHDLDQRINEIKSLESTVSATEKRLAELETASRRPSPETVANQAAISKLEKGLRIAEQKAGQLAPLEKELRGRRERAALQDEEIAQYKKDRDAARSQLKEQQGALAARDEEIAQYKKDRDAARSQLKE
ncbi:MAG: hypothetical protein ACYC9Y_09670, partial [Candidatus Methylomirabilia bacterium]